MLNSITLFYSFWTYDRAPIFNWVKVNSASERHEIFFKKEKMAYDFIASKYGETFKRILSGEFILWVSSCKNYVLKKGTLSGSQKTVSENVRAELIF